MSADTITVVLGPTASGKTGCAITLAEKTGGAVISADSRQVYAGMNIGTAKPADAWHESAHGELVPDPVRGRPPLGGRSRPASASRRTGRAASNGVNFVPHYLMNIRTPDNPLTLAQWQQAALAVLNHAHSKETPIIVAGGTMLYIDSILYNYAIPEVPPDEKLRDELMKRPTDELYQELLARDPAARQFIESHHKQRIIRALEVIMATGEPFSRLRQQRPSKYTFSVLGIFPGWEKLKQLITARTKRMFAEGLLEETEKLSRQYGATLPLLQTMGYREASSVLAGDMSAQEAQDAFCQAQLRYARRQMSWWKKRQEIRWISSVNELSTPLEIKPL